MISSLNNASFNIFNNLLILINKDFNTGSLFSNSCCVIMLAAALVLISLSQTPVKASKQRPYCGNTASQCWELHTSQCISQNEKFNVINEKFDVINEKLKDLNQKLEDQNENLKDQNEKIDEKLEDLNRKFETLIKQEQESEQVILTYSVSRFNKKKTGKMAKIPVTFNLCL